MADRDELQQARRAVDRRDWPEAYERLSARARGRGLEPADQERLAVSAHLTGHDEDATEAWTSAHLAWLDRSEPGRAALCAFWLGFTLLQRGEMAHASGWFARGRRIVTEHKVDGPEGGYLLLPDALTALRRGDHDLAARLCDEVDAIASRFVDADLAAFAMVGKGQLLLETGEPGAGAALFDEAMVSVIAGELSPIVSGIVYCAVVDACQQALDVRRAREWTAALTRWCDAQRGLVPYRGQCMVHRSQVLQLHGEWRVAMAEARQARERLGHPPHPAVGMAHYQVGELHRLRGELSEAEEAYRQAHECGRQPQPGLALLRLAQSRVDDAAAAIGAALDEAPDVLARSRLLPAYVEIMLAAGRRADARAAADELSHLTARLDAAMLRAAAAQACGAVLLAEGEPKEALPTLRDALRTWHDLEAPYEAGRTRALIALACWQLDNEESARLELDAARAAFEALGAAPALADLDELSTTVANGRANASEAPLTAREVDVLRLVATGMTNREIAGALVISEKTVERHLGNTFVKLGISNRAAATAYAYDHGLV